MGGATVLRIFCPSLASERLSPRARRLLEDRSRTLWWSAASPWEGVVKTPVEGLPVRGSDDEVGRCPVQRGLQARRRARDTGRAVSP